MERPKKETDELNDEQKECCINKSFRNGVLFSTAAIGVGVAIYYLIKERKRKKIERELFEYEIWA